MINQTENDNIVDEQPESADSDRLSINYSPIKTQDSRFMDLSPPDIIFNDRPPRFYRKKDNLRSVEEIPNKYQNLFEGFNHFNLVQSRVMDNVLYSDKSLVVSAPTGSGKTTIFELAIVRLMMAMEDINYTGDFKIIYMAPVKALCNERLCDWNRKFSEIGLSCIEVTGDTDRLEFKNLENYKIIITTPEKWDSITRKWRDNKEIVRVVKLFMIDEIHLLNDRKRGPTLEAVVSRMKIIQKSVEYELKQNSPEYTRYDDLMKKFLTHIRFVALSATIKNIEDIGQWLGDKTNKFESTSAIIQEFGEEHRPVPLNKIVFGYMCPINSSPFKFDLTLNYKLKSIIEEYSHNKPTLVFCTTRKGLLPTADVLCRSLTFQFSVAQKEFVKNSAKEILDKKLKEMLEVGIGWHHAGMDGNDRYIVEEMFRAGVVPVLLTTSTLSMGVNLPAHLVIIKSTDIYQSNGYENYSSIALQQMIGRAGRPQYDTSATAVIMTQSSKQKFYEDMLMGTEIIESNLHKHLGEHLNAEIVLHTITDLVVALDWMKTTFLYVRILKNPRYYGLTQPSLTSEKIETKLIELCQIEINKLKKLQLVKTDTELGVDLQPTRNGELMAQYYLSFTTMQLFLKINGTETLTRLINMISDSDEFSDIRLRVNDKKILNALNKSKFSDTIRFPFPDRISTLSMKINCVIQAVLGALSIKDSSLKIESDRIMKIGERISHCLCQYLITQEKGFVALRNALVLSKCFMARLWENSKYISRQFERIGPVTANLLALAEKTTFDAILNSNPRDLERICNRGPPFGNNFINYIKHLPKFSLRIIPPDVAAPLPRHINVILELLNLEDLDNLTTTGKNHTFSIIVGDTSNNILFYKKYRDEDILMTGIITHQIKLVQTDGHKVFGRVISETWVGLDVEVSRKMPPINLYLINAYKKYENSELSTNKSASYTMEKIHTPLEKHQTITGQDSAEQMENISEHDTSNDVLHQIISSVFDKKSNLSPNGDKLKQSRNSSTLSVEKNNKEPKIFATVTPFVDETKINSSASQYNLNGKKILHESSTNLNDSSVNTTLKNANENTITEKSNCISPLNNDKEFMSTNSHTQIISHEPLGIQKPENTPLKDVNKNTKTEKLNCISPLNNDKEFVSTNLHSPILSQEPLGIKKPKNTPKQISFNNCSQYITIRTHLRPILPKNTPKQISLNNSSQCIIPIRSHVPPNLPHNTPKQISFNNSSQCIIPIRSHVPPNLPHNKPKQISLNNSSQCIIPIRSHGPPNLPQNTPKQISFNNSSQCIIPIRTHGPPNLPQNTPKQISFNNSSQCIIPIRSHVPPNLPQNTPKQISFNNGSQCIIPIRSHVPPNLPLNTPKQISFNNSSQCIIPIRSHGPPNLPQNTPRQISFNNSSQCIIPIRSHGPPNLPLNTPKQISFNNNSQCIIPIHSLGPPNLPLNTPKQISFNNNSQCIIPIRSHVPPNLPLNTPKQISFNNCSQCIIPIRSHVPPNFNSHLHNSPILSQSLSNSSFKFKNISSNSANTVNFMTGSSQNIKNSESFPINASLNNNIKIPKTQMQLLPNYASNLKQVGPACSETICSNPVCSPIISNQNSNNSVMLTHSEINKPKPTSIHLPQINFDQPRITFVNGLKLCTKKNIQTGNNMKFYSLGNSNNTPIPKHNDMNGHKNVDIYKPRMNVEQTLPSQGQTNFLVSGIPDRDPSFHSTQGKVWIDKNFAPFPENQIDDFSKFALNNHASFSKASENSTQNNKSTIINSGQKENKNLLSTSFDKNTIRNNEMEFSTNFKRTHQVILPQYEIISDDEESNSSLTVETSGELDTSQNLEEKEVPIKKTKFNDEETTIPSCQIYRHKKFGKATIVPVVESISECSSEKLSHFKQSKKQLLPKTPNIQVLKVENVQYPNVSSLIMSPSEIITKNISWRSPLTSEMNISTPNSSCSSSDMSSPMSMTKLATKYPNTIRIEDYKTARVSTAHSIVKIDENSKTDIHQKATYSIKEKKFVVREIQVKTKIDSSSLTSMSEYCTNSIAKEDTSRSSSSEYQSSANHSNRLMPEVINYHNSIHTAAQENRSRSSNVDLRPLSASNSRQNEKLPRVDRIRASSGAVQNSATFKTTMKNILTQLSDKGASETTRPSSENNDLTQELSIPPNIQDYSVRSDFSVSDYRIKSKDIFHSKMADAIYKKNKENIENVDLCNHVNNNEQKEKPKATSNDDNVPQLQDSKKEYFSLFKHIEKSINRKAQTSSDVRISFNLHPTTYIENKFVNSQPIEPYNLQEVPQCYTNGFFNFNNTKDQENQMNPLNYSVPTSNQFRNSESHNYSNYVKSVNDLTIDNPKKNALRKNISRHISPSKNFVRLSDGPLVDLNEVNQYIETNSNDYNACALQEYEDTQSNSFDLSPKSFMKTLKRHN